MCNSIGKKLKDGQQRYLDKLPQERINLISQVCRDIQNNHIPDEYGLKKYKEDFNKLCDPSVPFSSKKAVLLDGGILNRVARLLTRLEEADPPPPPPTKQ